MENDFGLSPGNLQKGEPEREKLGNFKISLKQFFGHWLFIFIPRHLKKCGVLCYTLKKKCIRVSVRPSARPSAFRFGALS